MSPLHSLIPVCQTGSRKAKAAGGEGKEAEEDDEEEDDEDDESYKDEGEEDIELEEEELEEEELEEETMPPKRAPRKAAEKAAETIEAVTESVSSMSIAPKKGAFRQWSMDFSFPFMIKQFLHNARQSCTIDVFVPTVHEDKVRPRVVNGGNYLAISLVVPEFFPEEERVLVAAGNEDFNTNQAAAHSEVVQDIRKRYSGEVETLGSPQLIKLPFTCEEQIVHWSCDLFHGDQEVSGTLGEQQYFSVLRVDVVSIKQVQQRRNRGTMRVVGSPQLRDHRVHAQQVPLN